MGGAGRKSGIGESAPWDPKGLVLHWEDSSASNVVEISLGSDSLTIAIDDSLGEQPTTWLFMRKSDIPMLAEYFADLAKHVRGRRED